MVILAVLIVGRVCWRRSVVQFRPRPGTAILDAATGKGQEDVRETIHGLLGEVYDETTQRILDDVCEITHHAWQTCLNMSLLHFLQMCMHCGKAKPFRITKKDLDAVDPLNAPLRLKVGKTAHTPLYWLCAGLLPSHETMEDFHQSLLKY